MEEKLKQEAASSNQDGEGHGQNVPQHQKSPVRGIESPKYNLRLSPIQRFMTNSSPTLSPLSGNDSDRRLFNIDTQT